MAYTTINKSSDHFNTKLYTGNGGNQTITGVGHTPSFVWFKSRDAGNSHALVNSVSGTNKVLYSDTNSAEQSISAQTFNSDGFALVQDGGANSINSNGSTKVAWSWKLNGQGSANTDGSINTTYTSANPTSGVSISMYEGTGSNASFGHGLSSAPEFVMVKGLDITSQWYLYSKSVGAGKSATLDNASAFSNDTTSWQNTHPTASVVTIGNDGGTNSSGNTMLAYCFTPVRGFSSMGSYVGNGNASGPFIFTNGMKPAWVMIKRTDNGDFWMMQDTARTPTNVANKYFQANDAAAESTTNDVALDFLSNGFKIRNTGAHYNASGVSYFYLAFAEAPIVGSNNVPANAR